VLAAFIVATSTSVAFTLFGIPYPIVLGILCGVFNPIPYLGIFVSMIICIFTVTLVNPVMFWEQGVFIVAVISVLHFINAYFLEPNIAGKQVGLHPIMLIASLFIFGSLFGVVGLLVAVPGAAILMMFFNDWREKTERKENIIIDNE
jgi:predicted PurR-regulated permease PerM